MPDMKNRLTANRRESLPPVEADPQVGLSQAQVQQRIDAGWVSGETKTAGKTGFEIIFLHTFTFFNLIFVILAVLLVLGGSTVKNMTFLVVAFFNTVIGIVQEIRAKRAVDKLTLVAERPVRVIRDGRTKEESPQTLVRDDIAEFSAGDQIPADGILVGGAFRLDESLITGEAEGVAKVPGDEILSGSVVLSGRGRMRLTAVGADSFAARLTREARKNPRAEKSGMMRSLDRLIRVIGAVLIPAGCLLFRQEYFVLGRGLRGSVESVVAALVGMIPEGLYLLTSIAMAASALKLSREKVLVQDMNCIEALARVDVLCVDKTGTITEPKMEALELIPLESASREEAEAVLAALYTGREPDNDTARAMAERYAGKTDWVCESYVPFSSETKWSGGAFRDHGAFVIGAPEYILGSRITGLRHALDPWTEEGYRVLLLAGYDGAPIPGTLIPALVRPMAFCLLSGAVRENAREIFAYFEEQGVSIRVISGDNPRTASRVALQAGMSGAESYIDASCLETEEDFHHAVESYRVFGRVTPEQKRLLVKALQAQGHTVAMTGDGVNDLLAMKQADCSVAMASGAQAACQCASLVLLESDFAAMPSITAEGRRVINNIQRAAALFLVKNIFSLGLAVISLFTGWAYPFQPIHLTLISALTIGIPSFFLAMEPNYDRVTEGFLRGVLRRALPGGIANILLTLAAQALVAIFRLPPAESSILCTASIGTVGLVVLLQVCKPLRGFRRIVWSAMAAAMVGCFTLLGSLFELRLGSLATLPLLAGMAAAAPPVYFAAQWCVDRFDKSTGHVV